MATADPSFDFALVAKDDSLGAVFLREPDFFGEWALAALNEGDPRSSRCDRGWRDGEGGTGVGVG